MTAQRVLLIANPRSRQGTAVLPRVEAALRRAGFAVAAQVVEEPGELAGRIAAGAAAADLIVLAGGDGTFSCAAPAVMASGLPLGLIPTGTANDLARTLGIPFDPVAACAVIAAGRRRRIDLGMQDGTPFFNVAHIGFGVAVAQKHTNRRKRLFGVAAYLFSVRDAFRAHAPFWCEIDCDGRRARHRLDQLAIGNGRHYGGGMTVAADAAIDDGTLDLYAIPPLPWWRVLALLPRLRQGFRPRDTGALLMRGREVAVRTEPPLPISMDGEIVGLTPAHFRVLPKALEVFVPDDAGAAPWALEDVMVLRDPAEAALNEILLACDEAAEEHAYAAGLLGDAPVAETLRQAAQRRRETAAVLRRIVRAHGDLPRAAHGERELVRTGLIQLKAMLAEDRLRAVAADQAVVARRVVEACARLPDDAEAESRTLVAALAAEAGATEQALQALADA